MACTTCQHVLAASSTVTECMCIGDGPVLCRLHGVKKTAHLHGLCKRDIRYFQLWQQGNGPGQPKPAPSPLPLGNWLAAMIKAVTLGKIAPCAACDERAKRLNRLGASIAKLFGVK